MIVKTINYAPGNGEFGYGDLYLPNNINEYTKLFLCIHGGGWSSMDKSAMIGVAEFLCKNNSVVFNINYRLSSYAPWPACGEDCIKAAEYIMTAEFLNLSGLDSRQIYLIGCSAGGHLALYAGLRLPPEKIVGIIAVSPIGDPYHDYTSHPQRYHMLFGQIPDDNMLNDINPSQYLTANSPHILLTHSRFDEVVSIKSMENLVSHAYSIGVNMETLFYDLNAEGHSIWVPLSKPPKLYSFLEEKILSFISKLKT